MDVHGCNRIAGTSAITGGLGVTFVTLHNMQSFMTFYINARSLAISNRSRILLATVSQFAWWNRRCYQSVLSTDSSTQPFVQKGPVLIHRTGFRNASETHVWISLRIRLDGDFFKKYISSCYLPHHFFRELQFLLLLQDAKL